MTILGNFETLPFEICQFFSLSFGCFYIFSRETERQRVAESVHLKNWYIPICIQFWEFHLGTACVGV